MNGQMPNYDRYLVSLEKVGEPIMASQLPKIKMDLRGLSRYAKEKGVSVNELSEEEIRKFVPEKLKKII